jgi:hypothetical protein
MHGDIRILICITLAGAIFLKVFDDSSGILPNVTKIYSLAAFLQKEQSVEYLGHVLRISTESTESRNLQPGKAQQTAVLKLNMCKMKMHEGQMQDYLPGGFCNMVSDTITEQEY